MELIFRCFFALSLLLAASAFAERKEPVLGAEIIDRLIAPETRSQAFREVQIARQNENPRQNWTELPMAAFELYHQNILVTKCPQVGAAPPLYMVSYLWDSTTFRRYYSKSRMSRSEGFSPAEDAHKPAALVDPVGRFSEWKTSSEHADLSLPPEGKMEERVIVFLTSAGKVVHPFQGDNMTEGDIFKDLNGDGRYERVYSSNFMVYDKRKGEPDIWVQALRVETVDPESTRQFYILLNWQNKKSAFSPAWGWAVRDLDGDGVDEIVLGPIVGDDENAKPEVEVVYRWNAGVEQYVGPLGSYNDHYLLLDPKVKLWDELHRVKAEGGMHYEAIAQANAPVEVEVVEVPYDWRHREPYRHRSLAGASNEELLKFMCGWGPVVQAEAADVQSDSDVSVSANAGDVSSNHRFKFQSDWAVLTPKEATFTFVDTNQSHAHRNKYTLYYPTNLTQAEQADWVVLSSMQGQGVEVIRSSGLGTGRYVSAKSIRPLPEKYPVGEFIWKWKSGQMDPDRVKWLQESLWWLAQIRSEAKIRERGYGRSSTFTTNCFPAYMEMTPPSVRLLTDAGASLVDIKAERVASYSSSWREEFGPLQYLGFANRLFQDHQELLLLGQPSDMTIAQVFDVSPNFMVDLLAGRVPPQLATAMVRSAGDSGDTSLLPILQEIAEHVPERAAFELEWQRLSEALNALPSRMEVDDFRKKIDLEAQMAVIEQSMRDNLWAWLREPLEFAIRQLEVADDVVALSAWAEQAGQHGALWALERLQEIDAAAWQRVLTQVFLEQPSWRKKIINYLSHKDRALAEALPVGLPRVEQLAVVASSLAWKKPADLGPQTIQDLIATIRATELDAQTRVDALRILVPKNDPHTIESIEVDQVLLEVLQQEMQPQREPWPERYLVYDAALVLLLRDNLPMPMDLYIKGADTAGNQFSFGSYLALMVHLAVIQESEEARTWLIQWGHDFIEQDAGAWSRFAELAYTADLHQFGPFLERLATFNPQEVEGVSGIGKGRHPELKHGERYHRARQIAVVWSEPDPLTRAKCELLLGFNFGHQFGPDELYSPIIRSKARLQEAVGRLSFADREAFVACVQWCETAIGRETLGPQHRKYFEWVCETFAAPSGA